MLWYKSWLETRWRFLIGFGLLLCSAAATVMAYPKVQQLLTMVPTLDVGGEIGRRIREQAMISSTYHGYVWSQWFRQNLIEMWTIFAVLLGSGGLLSPASGGAALFTLSLPVSRRDLLGVRAITGLAELLVLAIVPSLMIPLLSPGVGETYSVVATLVHGLCLFTAGAVFFSFAFLLSTVFHDIWRPLLIALAVAAVIGMCEEVIGGALSQGPFGVMSAQSYFRAGALPWAGMLISAAISGALLYAASINFARRDF